MKTEIARLLKFGAAGHTLCFSQEGYSNCTQIGYEDPESFLLPYHWWADPPEKISLHFKPESIPAEGIPVIDMRAAVNTPEGYRWVFKGPMVNVDLPDGAIDALPEVSPFMLPAVAAYGMIGAMLETQVAQKEHKAGALDSVSVSEYVQGWREHGARIGTFKVINGKGQIFWEDEARAAITKAQGKE